MRTRGGFALIAALWLLVAVASLVAVGFASLRRGADISRNRVLLRRAAWARDACLEILLARVEAGSPLRGVDSTALGPAAWCRASVVDPAARLNVNTASQEALRVLLGSDSLAAAVIDWRDPDDVPRLGGAEAHHYVARRRPVPRNGPLLALEELTLVRGLEGIGLEALAALVTVEGDGGLNVNQASLPVLEAYGFSASEARRIIALRQTGWSAASLAELRQRVGVSQRSGFNDGLRFSSSELLVETEGGIGARPLRARGRAVLSTTGERLAIVRQEVW